MYKEKYALLVVNGEIEDAKYYDKYIENADYIIAADGGANFLYERRENIDYIVGDMDSINENALSYYEQRCTEIEKLNKKKDITDSERAVEVIETLGYSRIIMLGAYGDRIDHFLANLDLLYLADKKGIRLTMVNKKNTINLFKQGTHIVDADIGQTVSFNTISGDVYGITLEGFEYLLKDSDMKQGSFHMTSNVVISENPTITIKKGSILCIIIDD